MKIGFVLDDTLDSTDGVQQYVLLLGDWLTKQGNEVHYLVGQSQRKDLPNVHSLARNLKVRFNKNRLSIPLPVSKSAIRQLLKRYSFDVLHIQMPFSPFLAGKIISLAQDDTAVVGTFHIAPHSGSVKIASKLLGLTQSKPIRRFDQIISVSKVAKKFAKNTYGIDSQVIPNAINQQLWQSKNQKKPIDVLFVGRLVERKGCIYLLQAIQELKQQMEGFNLRVVIVGDGPQRKSLEGYVRSHQLEKYCHFVGYVSESKKRELVQSSKIAVYPATGGESFGIVLIESISAGVVVLAGNNPGYRSVLEGSPDALFEPTNRTQLARLIYSLITKPDLYQKIFQSQQILIKKFDINVVGGDILKTYKKAIRRRINGK